jgi:DNA-binding transcriptional regulator YiaG
MLHYTLSGLTNIWLANGYKWIETAYGPALQIEKVEDLHRAIGRALIARPRLTGREFRYLRVAMDLSQAALGDMFGKTDQAVALWEKGRGAPKWADRIMRALYREHVDGNAKLHEIFAKAEARADEKARRDETKVVRLNFEKAKRGGWRAAMTDTKRAA